ncbi:putative cell wall-binding domain [Chitinispirillum alkaliphilum]|nr:putative cell wall-binding domain [Chitinispirillum alkaliphilum]
MELNRLPLIVVLLFLATSSFAQEEDSINITGRVLDNNNNPVSGAIATLSSAGLSDTTDSDGVYRISNTTTPITRGRYEKTFSRPQLNNGRVSFSLAGSGNVRVSVYSINGRLISTALHQNLSQGNYHFYPLASNQSITYSSGVYLVKLQIGTDISTFRLARLGDNYNLPSGMIRNSETTYSDIQRTAKAAGVGSDTLIIERKNQIISKKVLTVLIDSLPDLTTVQRDISGKLNAQDGVEIGFINAILSGDNIAEPRTVNLWYNSASDAYSGFVYFVSSAEIQNYSVYIKVYDQDSVFIGRSETIDFPSTAGNVQIPTFSPYRPPVLVGVSDTSVSLTLTDSVTITVSAEAADDNCVIEKYYWSVDSDNWTDSTYTPEFTIRSTQSKLVNISWVAKDSDGLMTETDNFTVKFTRTVHFDPNGGTPLPETKQVVYGEAYGSLAATSREGYSFDGWWTEDGGEGERITYDNTVTVDEDHTLYAKWKPAVFTITYIVNGGENHPDNLETYTIETDTILLLPPSKTDYTFEGWYRDNNFTEKLTHIDSGSVGDISVYAKFVWNLVIDLEDHIADNPSFYDSAYRYETYDSLGRYGGDYSGGFLDSWGEETQIQFPIPSDGFEARNTQVNFTEEHGPMYWMALAMGQEYMNVDMQLMAAMAVVETFAGSDSFNPKFTSGTEYGFWSVEALSGLERASYYPHFYPAYQAQLENAPYPIRNINPNEFMGYYMRGIHGGTPKNSAHTINALIKSALTMYTIYDVLDYSTDICWKQALSAAQDRYMGVAAMLLFYRQGLLNRLSYVAEDLSPVTYQKTADDPNASDRFSIGNNFYHTAIFDIVQAHTDASRLSLTDPSVHLMDYQISKAQLMDIFFGDGGSVMSQGSGGLLLHYDKSISEREKIWNILQSAFDLLKGRAPSVKDTDYISYRYDFLTVIRMVKQFFPFERGWNNVGDAALLIDRYSTGLHGSCE